MTTILVIFLFFFFWFHSAGSRAVGPTRYDVLLCLLAQISIFPLFIRCSALGSSKN